MQNAVPINKGGMAAIIGSELSTVKKLIRESIKDDEVLEIALEKMPSINSEEEEKMEVEKTSVTKKSPLESNLPH